MRWRFDEPSYNVRLRSDQHTGSNGELAIKIVRSGYKGGCATFWIWPLSHPRGSERVDTGLQLSIEGVKLWLAGKTKAEILQATIANKPPYGGSLDGWRD